MVRQTNHRPVRRASSGFAILDIIPENTDIHKGTRGKYFKINKNKLKSWQQKKGDEE